MFVSVYVITRFEEHIYKKNINNAIFIKFNSNTFLSKSAIKFAKKKQYVINK